MWLDADGDGVQDLGEPGLANVTAELFDPGLGGMVGGGDDVLVATATTDANGNYLFDHLLAGDYFVAVDDTTLPTGLTTSPGTTFWSAPFWSERAWQSPWEQRPCRGLRGVAPTSPATAKTSRACDPGHRAESLASGGISRLTRSSENVLQPCH